MSATSERNPKRQKTCNINLKAKKGEIKLQSRLEKYKTTTDPNVPNCWVAYKKVKNEIMAENKIEKKNLKDNEPNIEKIHRLLSEASRMAKWGDTLKSQGREPQGEGAHKAAESRMQNAKEIFEQRLTQDEKDSLDEEELEYLRTLTVPNYPYRCNKTEIKEMEKKEIAIMISNFKTKIEECEKIIREEHMNVKAARALTKELVKQIENSLPFIQNESHRQKLERFLEQIK